MPCGKTQCPVCSVLADEQKKMTARGEAAEFMIDVLDDLRYSIAEAFLTIIDSTKETRSHLHAQLAQPRRSPRRFALYRKIDLWHEALHEVFDDAEELESIWTQSADAADTDWYVHILLDYLHRQLEYSAVHSRAQALKSVASTYARSVIAQTTALISDRLNRLALLDSTEKGTLIVLTSRFEQFKKDLARV